MLIRTQLFETAAVVGEARFVQERTCMPELGIWSPLVATVLTVLALGVAAWLKAER